MNSRLMLTPAEIYTIPAGRIMNTLIQEYVFQEFPSRWSESRQEDIPYRWFDEHPSACEGDDGGYCTADSILNYSGDLTRALIMTAAPLLASRTLSTRTLTTVNPLEIHWATFSTKPFELDQSHVKSNRRWASGDTLALAICRAALIEAQAFDISSIVRYS